jgi:N-acetylneuraminic acid mutarotase
MCQANNTCIPPALAAMPTVRWGLALVRGPDGKLYAIGGEDPATSTALPNVEAYDPDTNTWEKKASLTTPRADLVAVEAGGKLYAIGGAANTTASTGLATVESYDPVMDKWKSLPDMPTWRTRMAVASLGGVYYLFGGADITGRQSASTVAFDPVAYTFTVKAPMPTARSLLAAAVGPDGLIYAIGGYSTTSQRLATVEAYDPRSNSWTPKADMPTARQSLATVADPDGTILAIGGYPQTTPGAPLATVEAYDTNTNSWAPAPDMPSALHRQGAALGNDGLVYVVGGFSTTGATNHVAAYAPGPKRWFE